MAHAPKGDPFVDDRLKRVWGDHGLKLEVVHSFLVEEQYWFDVATSNSEENSCALGAVEEWRQNNNSVEKRGFYVYVSLQGDPVAPDGVADADADADAVREVIGHVDQIGWQLHLDEHTEGKRRRETEQEGLMHVEVTS